VAANWELQLVSAILSAEDRKEAMAYALENGIRLELFGTMAPSTVWAWMHSVYTNRRRFGAVPSRQKALEQFKNLELPTPIEELETLVDYVKSSHIHRKTTLLVADWEAEAKANPIQALTELKSKLDTLTETEIRSDDVVWRERAFTDLLENLGAKDENAGLTGLPFPWAVMNENTGGLQPGDLVLLWALPKSKKTWIGLVMANYLMECGYRVLVYSKEMVWDKIRDRIACIKAMIGYAGFTKNTLRADERFRLLAAIEQTVSAEYPGELIFTSCDRPDGSAGGPAELRAKIQTYKPHFVFLDSSYMLELPGVKDAYDWRAIAGITRALKQISKSTGIPMLAIMQENERLALKYGNKGRGTASISMFSNMIQDADVGIRVVNHPTRDETSLVMAACRETNWPGCTIHTKLCQNFDYAHDHLYGIEEVSDAEEEGMPDPPEDLPDIRPGASFADQYLNPDADFDLNPTEPEPEA
jgi:hypothetical protein